MSTANQDLSILKNPKNNYSDKGKYIKMNIIDMLLPLTTTSIFSRICMVPSQTFLLVPLPTGDSPVAAWRTQHTIISIRLVSCLSSISVKFRKIKSPSKLYTFSKAIMANALKNKHRVFHYSATELNTLSVDCTYIPLPCRAPPEVGQSYTPSLSSCR